MHKLRCLRQNSTDSYTSINTTDSPPKKRPMWQTILIIIGIVIFTLAFLLFLAIWVILPIVFMETISLQRFMMFINIDQPKHPEFSKPEKYDVDGVVNFYITTKDLDNSSLVNIGLWMLLPEDEINSYPERSHTAASASQILADTKKPVLLYLHGVACNRIFPVSTYDVARKQFLVIAVDYRGFGDSDTNAELSELGVINDNVQLFKWVRSKTLNPIYVWGHSLGSALSTHTVKALRQEDIVPTGLILESPFTTMREEMVYNPIGKIFKWLAYFNQTILDPVERNGFLFRSTSNILFVDCPIMIMHAEDDDVIPYFLGKQLSEVAQTQRDLTRQGSVTYHQLPALGYKHVGITTDPAVPQYIEEFMGICKSANKARG